MPPLPCRSTRRIARPSFASRRLPAGGACASWSACSERAGGSSCSWRRSFSSRSVRISPSWPSLTKSTPLLSKRRLHTCSQANSTQSCSTSSPRSSISTKSFATRSSPCAKAARRLRTHQTTQQTSQPHTTMVGRRLTRHRRERKAACPARGRPHRPSPRPPELKAAPHPSRRCSLASCRRCEPSTASMRTTGRRRATTPFGCSRATREGRR
mmetsp:Transcript_17710/g.44523  ORF Transcript_17710/g.44523 Transcript_17710/m.44523 type:complete len:212 (-) Transcript_17710:1177-1812(-)